MLSPTKPRCIFIQNNPCTFLQSPYIIRRHEPNETPQHTHPTIIRCPFSVIVRWDVSQYGRVSLLLFSQSLLLLDYNYDNLQMEPWWNDWILTFNQNWHCNYDDIMIGQFLEGSLFGVFYDLCYHYIFLGIRTWNSVHPCLVFILCFSFYSFCGNYRSISFFM